MKRAIAWVLILLSIPAIACSPFDVNCDGTVDVYDLVELGQRFGIEYNVTTYTGVYSMNFSLPQPDWQWSLDLNGDGEVNIYDVVGVAQHFGINYGEIPQCGGAAGISFTKDELSVSQLWSTPIPGQPVFTVGGGVRVIATNSSGALAVWCLNLSADKVEIVPAVGAGVAGVTIVEVSGGVAILITDPSVQVKVDSGEISYVLKVESWGVSTTDVGIYVAGKKVATIEVPSSQFMLNGTELRGSLKFASPPPPPPDVPNIDKWYAGQLHAHTTYSDGKLSAAQLIQAAKDDNLDFLVISDHDTLSAYSDPAVTGESELLIVKGYEWSSSNGHANVYGNVASTVSKTASASVMFDTHHNEGAIVCINHPNSTDQVAWKWGMFDKADCIEVWNWDWNVQNNGDALKLWNSLLQQGYKVTAVAGADFHYPIIQEVDSPHVLVYSQSKTMDGILSGIKNGRVSMVKDGDISRVWLFADANGDGNYDAMIGDTIYATFGQQITFTVYVSGTSQYDDLEVYTKKGKIIDQDIPSGPNYVYNFTLTATGDDYVWVYIEQPWWKAYRPNAITNPIFIKVSGTSQDVYASSMSTPRADVTSGSLDSTKSDDGSYLEVKQHMDLWQGQTEYDLDVRFNFAVSSTPGVMALATDAWAWDDTAYVEVYNSVTGQWDRKGEVAYVDKDPGVYTIPICNGDCSKYISSGTVTIRMFYDSGWPSDQDWVRIDYLALRIA